MNDKKLRKYTLDLMTRTKATFLTTIDEMGLPHIRAVENLRNPEKFSHQSKAFIGYDDEFLVLISTNTSSEKVKHIKNNPNIALYYCILEEYKGVMIRGCAKIESDLEFKKKIWEDSMKIYYPKGIEDPDFTLIRLIPDYIKAFYNLKTYIIDLRNKK
ncbi:MAG: pyridoxamine 5'-phosphate oxidase family protein [Candidatus Hermodarchaeota archaeon]